MWEHKGFASRCVCSKILRASLSTGDSAVRAVLPHRDISRVHERSYSGDTNSLRRLLRRSELFCHSTYLLVLQTCKRPVERQN